MVVMAGAGREDGRPPRLLDFGVELGLGGGHSPPVDGGEDADAAPDGEGRGGGEEAR